MYPNLNSDIEQCIKGDLLGCKMFSANTFIDQVAGNNIGVHVEDLTNYLPPDAKIKWGVASIIGTWTPYIELSGPSVIIVNDKIVSFRIYNNASITFSKVEIGYIVFYE